MRSLTIPRNRLTTLRSTLAVLIAVLATTGSDGCESTSGGSSDEKNACDLRPYRPDSPHISHTQLAKGRVVILGKVAVICDPAPERHHLTIWLEIKVGDGWQVMAESETKEIPTRKRKFFLAEYDGCRPGTWRTRAQATGRLQRRHFKFQDTSKSLTITQDDCDDANKKARRGR
jgi:hypothetical protein